MASTTPAEHDTSRPAGAANPPRRGRRNTRKRPDALGTTERLPSGRWRAYYSRDGRRFPAPHTFESRADAQDWLAAERADRARGTWRDPAAHRITLEQFAADWLATRVDLAPTTADYYAHLLRAYLLAELPTDRGRPVCLRDRHVAELSPPDIRAWFAAVTLAAAAQARATLSPRPRQVRNAARAWAKAQGLPVAATGRLSPAILSAWQQAGRPQPRASLADAPRTLDPEQPGRATAAKAYGLLRTILGTAVRDGLIPANPCNLRGAGTVRAKRRTIASPAEVEQLAALMPRRYAAAVTLAAWSSLRYGELFALARRHVDLDAGLVRVDRALQRRGTELVYGPTKTAGSVRSVHLPAFVVAELAAHMAEFTDPDPDALVFPNTAGGPLHSRELSRMFARARRVIERPELTWHDLRHTGATLAYKAGASVPEVQARLGHTTMRAALIYAHVMDDSDRVLAQRLDAQFAPTPDQRPRLRAV